MTRVTVLGASGMLGGAVARAFSDESGIEVVAPARGEFEAGRDDPRRLLDAVRSDWVVNTIAVLAGAIDPADPASVERATRVNAEFPRELADAAVQHGVRVVNASTDGVFSGDAGPYSETDEPDATDLYGKSKSLGEAAAEGVLHLRCSIIGPEARVPPRSLVGRTLALEAGARLTGWTDHRWNGVTTLAWARVCAAIVRAGELPPSPLHLLPGDVVTKYELLGLIAAAFGRDDLQIDPGTAPAPSDRTLATVHPEAVARLWRAAGYDAAPTIAAMIAEQAGAQ